MNVKFYNKLIRDFMPDIIRAEGNRPGVEQVSGEKYIQALEAKLAEEVSEYLESRSIEELADVKEVLSKLVAVRGEREVEIARILKHKERGGFEQGQFLFWVEFVEEGSEK